MIRLNIASGPKWIDVLEGVRFKMRPCTSTIMAEARSSESIEKLVEAGASNQALAICLAKEVAVLALDEWDGVGGEDGAPVAPSRESISAALDIWPIFEAFQTKYMAPALAMDAEKNDSAPSQTGTSAAATNTAKGARSRAKSARTASTGRKR